MVRLIKVNKSRQKQQQNNSNNNNNNKKRGEMWIINILLYVIEPTKKEMLILGNIILKLTRRFGICYANVFYVHLSLRVCFSRSLWRG